MFTPSNFLGAMSLQKFTGEKFSLHNCCTTPVAKRDRHALSWGVQTGFAISSVHNIALARQTKSHSPKLAMASPPQDCLPAGANFWRRRGYLARLSLVTFSGHRESNSNNVSFRYTLRLGRPAPRDSLAQGDKIALALPHCHT